MKGYLFDENLPANVTFKSSLPIYHVSSLGKSPKDADFSEGLMLDESPAIDKLLAHLPQISSEGVEHLLKELGHMQIRSQS
jgi:hypothetical protein